MKTLERFLKKEVREEKELQYAIPFWFILWIRLIGLKGKKIHV